MSALKRQMARSLSVLFLAGSLFAAVALFLPHPPGSYESGIFGVSVAAVVGAALLRLVPPARIPDAAFHVALGLGTMLISLAIYFWRPGEVASAVAMIYVWILLYAFYFFDTRWASAHSITVGAAYAITLAVQHGHLAAITNWIVTVGTATIAGALIGTLTRQVAASAALDPLTGIANRRRFEEALQDEVARCRRNGRSLAVALADLDQFKALNDSGGHVAGDRALVALAALWREQCREMDLVARYGGDEFAVLLRECDARAAEESMRRLTDVATAHPCTVGIACWDGSEQAADVVNRADAALYRGKAAGRKRIVIAD